MVIRDYCHIVIFFSLYFILLSLSYSLIQSRNGPLTPNDNVKFLCHHKWVVSLWLYILVFTLDHEEKITCYHLIFSR